MDVDRKRQLRDTFATLTCNLLQGTAMTTPIPPSYSKFSDRIRTAGIAPGDSEELRLYKSLLMLATGLICVAIMVWVAIYHLLGLNLSLTLPLSFQLLLAGNLILYFKTLNFDFFRNTQLGLFLFLPFVAQWSAGDLIVSSGVVLWGVLAPIGAILCIGARESLGWFIAWVVLTAISGGVDYYLADLLVPMRPIVPPSTSLIFFTLNIIAVASISYALLLFSIEQKRRAQERLAQSEKQVSIAQDAADNLFVTPLV